MSELTRTVFLEDASIEVRYDFDAGEAMTRDHPGCDEEVTINALQINGEWVSPDCFDEKWLDKIVVTLLEETVEALKDAEAEAAISAHEARMDDFRADYL